MVKALDKYNLFKNNKAKEKEMKRLFAFLGELRGVQLKIFSVDIQKIIKKFVEAFLGQLEKRKQIVESEEQFRTVKNWMIRFRLSYPRIKEMVDLDKEVQRMFVTDIPEFQNEKIVEDMERNLIEVVPRFMALNMFFRVRRIELIKQWIGAYRMTLEHLPLQYLNNEK